MKILGISPLDKDATVSLVEDGKILFAAAEERYSRLKQHAGFPEQALQAALDHTGTGLEEIDVVAYPFLDWPQEAALISDCFDRERQFERAAPAVGLREKLRRAKTRVPNRNQPVYGLKSPSQRMDKGPLKELFYSMAGVAPGPSGLMARRASRAWERAAVEEHRRWNRQLEARLSSLGLAGKLERHEHHLSHAANSYYASGLDRALIVTLDGYGSGLGGSISVGEGGKIRRLQNLSYPYSLGTYYETVTASLGFNPNRHGGKIVGLAAYGDPTVLSDAVMSRFDTSTPGSFRIHQNLNVYFSRYLASSFPMVDVAAAYQHVLEVIAAELVHYWAAKTGSNAVVLSGGVVANVKMNQRIQEVEGVDSIFVYPNMGDGGCGTGIALSLSWPGGVGDPIHDVFLGPSFSNREIEQELDRAGLAYEKPEQLAAHVARRLHAGEVVGRFSGRMEYGPRALGNRSILYHARQPDVNQWLNQRLGRTEFMPFAPVTLWEERHRCYENCAGAEHAAQFMTITFDCTESMKQSCPAAVHVDGTARPQLIRREVNPEYYDIVEEYGKLSDIPTLINTSFNMHEEPIVCTPADAVRAFLLGDLDGLAIGPYYVENPRLERPSKRT